MKMNSYHRTTIYALTVISTLFISSGLHAQERLPVSEAFSEGTKQFLSDPARTGSLVGSILVGAAVANPLAPLVGSVAGFMIGKSSAFSKKNSNAARRDAYANRSLVPENDVEVTSLAGLTGNALPGSEQTTVVGLSGETGMRRSMGQGEPTIAAALHREEDTGNQREEILTLGFPEETGVTGARNLSERGGPLVIVELPEESVAADQSVQTVAMGLTERAGAGSNVQRQLARACSDMQRTQPVSMSCYYYSQ